MLRWRRSARAVIVCLAIAMAAPAGAQPRLQSPSKLGPLVGATTQIARASASPTQVGQGDPVKVSAVIRSPGGPSGPFSVLLRLDGRELSRQRGDLAAGAERTFTFDTRAPDKTGEVCYQLHLQGEPGGMVTLKDDASACLTVASKVAGGAGVLKTVPLSKGGGPLGSSNQGPAGRLQGLAPGAIALKLDGSLSLQEAGQRFKTLPDDARIQLKTGQVLTKRELLAESERRRQAGLSRFKKGSLGGAADSQFAALKTQFEAKQTAELATSRARVLAELQRVSGAGGGAAGGSQVAELESLHLEARQLRERYDGASPAEKAQLEARAEVLLARARQLLNK